MFTHEILVTGTFTSSYRFKSIEEAEKGIERMNRKGSLAPLKKEIRELEKHSGKIFLMY